MRVVESDEPLAVRRVQCERIPVGMCGAFRLIAPEGHPCVITVLENELVSIVVFQSGVTA
jgi:hypothetical protein